MDSESKGKPPRISRPQNLTKALQTRDKPTNWLTGSRAAKKYSKLEILTLSGFTGAKMAFFDLFLAESSIICLS